MLIADYAYRYFTPEGSFPTWPLDEHRVFRPASSSGANLLAFDRNPAERVIPQQLHFLTLVGLAFALVELAGAASALTSVTGMLSTSNPPAAE